MAGCQGPSVARAIATKGSFGACPTARVRPSRHLQSVAPARTGPGRIARSDLRPLREPQHLHLGPAANVQLLTDNTNKQVRINYVESGIGKSLSQPLPDGITVNNITVSYSTLGSATPATTITLTATASRKVCIEDTGYAHACN